MSIYSSISRAKNSKKLFYLQQEQDNIKHYLVIMPFEGLSEREASQAAADMVTLHDMESCDRNEPKEARATVSFQPASEYDEDLLKEIYSHFNYVPTYRTFIAVRYYLFDSKLEKTIPFYGTVRNIDNGKWDFKFGVIEPRVFSYEHTIPISQEQYLMSKSNSEAN